MLKVTVTLLEYYLLSTEPSNSRLENHTLVIYLPQLNFVLLVRTAGGDITDF